MENSEMYDYFAQKAQENGKSQPYLDKSYSDKRRILREYSIKDEIREYIDMLCDEIITRDKPSLSTQYSQDSKKAHEIFDEILVKTGFNDNTVLWNTIKDFLIDGFVAMEIIWENDKIIGLNRLRTDSLVPAYDKEHGNYWIQYPTDKLLKRVLYDNQIIFISYSSQNDFSETSYVEGLIRPYNILTNIEQSMVMASIMSATIYQKFTIPIKGLSKTKAEEQISQLIENYSEHVDWDDTLGTIKINGSKNIPYSKQYWFPESDQGKYEMTNLKNDVSLDNYMTSLDYFKDKLKRASKFPNDDNNREIRRFTRFISLIRKNFMEILYKPFSLVLKVNNINDISYEINL